MEQLKSIIESILFVSGDGVAIRDISEKLEVTDKEVLNACKELQKKYDSTSGINLIIYNKKVQFCSNKAYAEPVSLVLNPIKERKLTNSMLEVAAIIAYKQPVTRLELEELRGVNSEYVIQNLLSLGLIEVVGRKDAVGRPVLFGTTDKFLKRFQIESLGDLPDYEELISKIAFLNGKTEGTYLFERGEYDESTDPDLVDTKEIGKKESKEKVVEQITIEEAIEDSKQREILMNEKVEEKVENLDKIEDEKKEPEESEEDGFELKDFDDEEVPDFLKGEDIDVID